MITILQAYKLYQEIKYTSNQPRIAFRPNYKEYQLETRNYHMLAQSTTENKLYMRKFYFQATDKRSGEVHSNNANIAQILFEQIQKSTNQK